MPQWREVKISHLAWTHLISKQQAHKGDREHLRQRKIRTAAHKRCFSQTQARHQVCCAWRNTIHHYQASWTRDLTNPWLFPYSLAKQRHVQTIFLLLSHLLVGSRSTYTSYWAEESCCFKKRKKPTLLWLEALEKRDSMLYWFYTPTEHSNPLELRSAALMDDP